MPSPPPQSTSRMYFPSSRDTEHPARLESKNKRDTPDEVEAYHRASVIARSLCKKLGQFNRSLTTFLDSQGIPNSVEFVQRTLYSEPGSLDGTDKELGIFRALLKYVCSEDCHPDARVPSSAIMESIVRWKKVKNTPGTYNAYQFWQHEQQAL
jgi:hypothetical protein